MSVRRTFWAILALLAFAILGGLFFPAGPFPIPNQLRDQTDIRIFTRIIVVCVGLIVVCWVWAYFSLSAVLVRRDARVLRQQVGQIFEERYRVSNRLPLARLWLEIRDDSGLPGNSGSRVLSLIGANQQRSYVAYTLLNQRGAFRLGPTMISSGDPFGLFKKNRSISGANELLVLPYIVNLTRFPSPAGQFPGGKAILQKATEVTPQAAGVREYYPGDALRSIHWPSSARKDRLMVKEFEQDPQADVWIFLDAENSVHIASDEPQVVLRIDQLWLKRNENPFKLPVDTFEYAVSAAGSVAAFYLRQGRAVGLVCASEVTVVLPPERGERQLNKILENLTFLKSNGKLSLLGLVETEAPQLPRASTVVLITPSPNPSVELAVDALIMRRLRPVMIYLDGPSFGSTLKGDEFLFRLKYRGIPIVIVKNDAPLQDSLEALA
jgi:uncharacterized protein (DUF58 family)